MTAASTKRLVLHAGVGKTGSSALQSALVHHRELLGSRGIRYPAHASDDRARAGAVTSGNGTHLRRWLVPRADTSAGGGRRLLARLLEEIETPGTHTLLYSSEFLYLARPERLDRMRRRLAEHDIALQAVIYLRDIAGHAMSSYSQVVKRGLFTGGFSDYIAPGTPGGYHLPLDRVLALVDVLGGQQVEVVHYDSVRDDLVSHFCSRVLGVHDVPVRLGEGSVNRSFTGEELDVMRRINQRLSSKAQARRISDILLDLPPLGSTSPRPSSVDLETLRSRFATQVDRVNRQFFDDVPTLAIVGRQRASDPEQTSGDATTTSREQRLIDVIARLTDT